MDTFVPTHVCARTRLCPDTFMHRHDCVKNKNVHIHECAQTRFCRNTNCGQARTCPWSIIILCKIVSTRLCINMIGENTSMLNCFWRSEVKRDYLTTAGDCYEIFLLEYFYYNMQGTKYVSGHNCVWAEA